MPIKELGLSGFTLGFQSDYRVLKVWKVRKIRGKKNYSWQKKLHFINRIFQHVGREFLMSSSYKLLTEHYSALHGHSTEQVTAQLVAGPRAWCQLLVEAPGVGVKAALVCTTYCRTNQLCPWSWVELLCCLQLCCAADLLLKSPTSVLYQTSALSFSLSPEGA